MRAPRPKAHATDDDPASDVAREIGEPAVVHAGDVAGNPRRRRLVQLALRTCGRLDIVINNALFGRARMLRDLSDDEWDDVVSVHLRETW